MKRVAFAAAGCAVLLLALSLGAAPHATRAPSCNCVAFRLDDIQDYFLNHVQLHVMEVFDRRNASLTVGIIGNFFGNDPAIVSYVKGRASDPLFEVANHGWNHEDFSGFDKEGQAALMQMANEKILDTVGIRPAVFVAPYNIINADTFYAAEKAGMRYISANVTYDPPPYDIAGNQSTYRLPETAFTGDLNTGDTDWITFDHRHVFGEVEDSLDKYGFAVVTMHPQDFAVSDMLNFRNQVDGKYISELEMLLDLIADKGIKIVTLGEITLSTVQVPEISVQSAQPRKEHVG